MLRLKHNISMLLCIFACGFFTAPRAKLELLSGGHPVHVVETQESLRAAFDPQLAEGRQFFMTVSPDGVYVPDFVLQQKYRLAMFAPEVHREICLKVTRLADDVKTLLAQGQFDEPVEDFANRLSLEDLEPKINSTSQMDLPLGRFVLKTFNYCPETNGVANTVLKQITRCDEMKICNAEGTLMRVECGRVAVDSTIKKPLFNLMARFVNELNDIIPE